GHAFCRHFSPRVSLMPDSSRFAIVPYVQREKAQLGWAFLLRRPLTGPRYSLRCRATLSDLLPAAFVAASAPYHEADIGEARHRRRLKDALHDQCRNVHIHLQNGYSVEVLARVELCPQIALSLQDIE